MIVTYARTRSVFACLRVRAPVVVGRINVQFIAFNLFAVQYAVFVSVARAIATRTRSKYTRARVHYQLREKRHACNMRACVHALGRRIKLCVERTSDHTESHAHI